MKNDKSCGVVVYRQLDKEIEYLLLQSKKHKEWGFPKGHVEGTETELETAIREVREESGITIEPTSNFRTSIEYFIDSNTKKEAVYFIAFTTEEDVVIQECEIIDYTWTNLPNALDLLPYDNIKNVLKKANEFILNP